MNTGVGMGTFNKTPDRAAFDHRPRVPVASSVMLRTSARMTGCRQR